MPHGFTEIDWQKAKKEARDAMIAKARGEDTITYSELVRKITSVSLEPNDPRLAQLLGEISIEENKAGRGMLTVLVVRQNGDKMPGNGFFDLAKELGRDTTDREKFWIEELTRVYNYWASRPGPS